HDVEESLAIADRIILVGQGRIMAMGTPQAMRESSDPFVRQFIDGTEQGPVPFHAPGPSLDALLALNQP
ncbi:MAG: ABC transporter ATP-binding protein, partial [Betaproteobacteria bacterium]|nr:ABC transporter ATP-binding protein [Betaproteobacteria bacterium]